MPRYALIVNGRRQTVETPANTPLLYVLRDRLALDGPQFGCGLGQCGACAVLVGKTEVRSCQTPVGAAADKPITTLEGLPALWKQDHGGAADTLHPVQQAWIEEQVPQCGYCQNGMMMQAAALLYRNPRPTEQQIKTAMDGHLCRCATYLRIVRAVRRAAQTMVALAGGQADA